MSSHDTAVVSEQKDAGSSPAISYPLLLSNVSKKTPF